ncbi:MULTISPECIES: UbiA family prenyltransferase [Acetobacter]|jgi:4-hydroxybenzoate polyprenyltransferase|uniref:UbiA family prenyltransferase n=1 Tax=Acetobacter TaxID=434 RepID=UPI00376FFD04
MSALDKKKLLTSCDDQKRRKGLLREYISIARLDHITKQIFVVPGIILAYLLRGDHSGQFILNCILGFIAAIAIASANYVINEYLDRDFDKHHPVKSQRSAVQYDLNGKIILCEWMFLVIIGFIAALLSSVTMLVIAVIFAAQGIVYNVPPLRTKDKAYLDVISESINNPLRLMIGWAIVDPMTLPPASIILAYWLGGAFLMAAKRYSEYLEIVNTHGKNLLVQYRASFAGYTETSLNASCFFYAMLSSFFLAVFFVKYRIEYILVMPPLIALFTYYLVISFQPGSAAQNPENLFHDTKMVVLVSILGITFLFCTYVNIPQVYIFSDQHFIAFK